MSAERRRLAFTKLIGIMGQRVISITEYLESRHNRVALVLHQVSLLIERGESSLSLSRVVKDGEQENVKRHLWKWNLAFDNPKKQEEQSR